MKSEHIYTPNTTGPYPPSLTCDDEWSAMKLLWSSEKQKFSKTPTDLRTGLPGNSDQMGVAFSSAVAHLTDNTVLSYRRPYDSGLFLGLIDCDRCVASDGSISKRVLNLLRYMDTYAEYSVTDGIHLLCCLDAVPRSGNKDREWDMEFYWQRHSIPITGKRVVLTDWESPYDVQPRTDKYLKLHKSRFAQVWSPPKATRPPKHSSVLTADEILSKLFNEADGNKWRDIYVGSWKDYYRSPSDADLALLMKLAFYSGKDRNMMESMFSECPLAELLIRGTLDEPTVWRTPKWQSDNYRKRSLDAAIEKTTNIYSPRTQNTSQQDFYRTRRQQIHENRKA